MPRCARRRQHRSTYGEHLAWRERDRVCKRIESAIDHWSKLISEGLLLEEIEAKLKLPATDPDTTHTSTEVIDGTRIPRKMWPKPKDEFDSCHGHGEGDCERWSLDIKPSAQGGDTERWQLTLEPHNPSACTSQPGNSGSCSHHHHGHGTSAVWL